MGFRKAHFAPLERGIFFGVLRIVLLGKEQPIAVERLGGNEVSTTSR